MSLANTFGSLDLETMSGQIEGGGKVNEVSREYNGLGQLVREWQSHIGAGGPAPMMPKDRSKFLATLDQAVQSVRKMFRKRP